MLALVVINKYSRDGNSNIIDIIENTLKQKYRLVTSFVGSKAYTINEHIKSYGAAYDLICAVGGDGTIHEVVNGVSKLKRRPVIGIIPAGTCNDIAHTLGIPKDIKKALDLIIKHDVVRLPLFKINNTYFIYGLALGMLSDVSYLAKAKSKKRLGRLAYYLEAFKNINKSKGIDAYINGKKDKYCFILFLNSHYLAGFRIRYKSNRYLDNGDIKLITINKSNRLFEIIDLGLFFLFGEYLSHNTRIKTITDAQIEVVSPASINADGEAIGKIKNICIEPSNAFLEFIVNKKNKNKIIK